MKHYGAGARIAQEIAASQQKVSSSSPFGQKRDIHEGFLQQQGPHRPFAAVISYCCLPQKCFVAANYPVPLLTVLGARDGLVRLSQASGCFEKLSEDFPDPVTRAKRVPVAIYPKFSHRWFSLGAGA